MTRLFRIRRRAEFSLLEIIVALGVLAIGATAAFALLVAAAAAGRRAEHQVNASLLAETLLNDAQALLEEGGVNLQDLSKAADADPVPGGPTPTVPTQQEGLETRFLERNAQTKSYPGYKFDIAVTPLESPEAGKTWHYLIEVEVRWSEKGKRRSAVFQTVRLKTLNHRSNPQPSARRRP